MFVNKETTYLLTYLLIGPLLFNPYINDVVNDNDGCDHRCTSQLCADDLKLYTVKNDSEDFRQCLAALVKWSRTKR